MAACTLYYIRRQDVDHDHPNYLGFDEYYNWSTGWSHEVYKASAYTSLEHAKSIIDDVLSKNSPAEGFLLPDVVIVRERIVYDVYPVS